ncbi:hypothetical protein NP233_g6194 [Leucocoprinus birnbaumii]|uniref:Phosphoglycerate mutase-like protein n=1 Tax=Leucocoprinus birnbaumii TaxID=56174 RepID=A0AAD5VUZ2_9AGAR|nr:hypothetical protein NP233_g6194 [Leucocoprinus birnbaumii]
MSPLRSLNLSTDRRMELAPSQSDWQSNIGDNDNEKQSHRITHPERGDGRRLDIEAAVFPANNAYGARRGSYWIHLFGAFALGALWMRLGQSPIFHDLKLPLRIANSDSVDFQASPQAGSPHVHHYPPKQPINKFLELFPQNVGYEGVKATGAEAAIVATAPAWPVHTGAPQLVVPTPFAKPNSQLDEHQTGLDGPRKEGPEGRKFNMLEKWGHVSPWYSIERGGFGVDSGIQEPDTCRVTGLHFLHHHGARYPNLHGGPPTLAKKLHKNARRWIGIGKLDFLNHWTYKLGVETLTTFGRQQLFDLGSTMRMKYGFLLRDFTKANTIPVFRTLSPTHMVDSAQNFALGFFGYPIEGQYQQSITIEENGYNNSLIPKVTCPNADNNTKAGHEHDIQGFNLTISDVFAMQEMCAFETVALGYSKFCELFTEDEWEGFKYAMDPFFWYSAAFGSPVARLQGIGWIQELVARLTHTSIAIHNSSSNGTLDDNPITFPLNHTLYVDVTHKTVLLPIIAALNLTGFAQQGPLPYTHIPKTRSFRASELVAFATNIQFQLLECTSLPGPQIRIIINDGVVPLTGIKGCPAQKDEIRIGFGIVTVIGKLDHLAKLDGRLLLLKSHSTLQTLITLDAVDLNQPFIAVTKFMVSVMYNRA